MTQAISRRVGGFVLACFMIAPAQAAVKPHVLFSDNGVLQQKVKVPVWGTTDQNEKVTVSFAGPGSLDDAQGRPLASRADAVGRRRTARR